MTTLSYPARQAWFAATLALPLTLVIPDVAAAAPTPVYRWTTIAGRASSGDNDGLAADARFNAPTGLTADVAGNVYVADTGNHSIRKISPGGIVSTFAGTAGQPGNIDGVGAAARFRSPWDLAADASGNIYVSDGVIDARLLRKITPAGAVTTIKLPDGRNLAGFKCIDPMGNIYVWENWENKVLGKLANGQLQTIQVPATATDWTGKSVAVSINGGPAADAAGQLYFTLSSTHYDSAGAYASVVKLDPSGNLSMVRGTSNGLYGSGIFNDAAGNIYQTHDYRGWGGTPGYYFGSPLTGSGPGVTFVSWLGSYASPAGMAVGPGGNWYYTRREDDAIINGDATTFAGTLRSAKPVDGPAQSSRCTSVSYIAADSSGTVWMTENTTQLIAAGDYIATNAPSLRQVTAAGIVTTIMAPRHPSNPSFGYTRYAIGLAPDGAGGAFLPQWYNAPLNATKELYQVSPAGIDRFLGYMPEDGTFFRMDSAGRARVLSWEGILRRQLPDGTWEVIASSSNVPEIKDGIKGVAQFSNIETFATDGPGNCIVLDQLPYDAAVETRSFYIRRLAPDGAVKTIGPRHTVSKLANRPSALGADSKGRIFLGYSDRITLLDEDGNEAIIGGKSDSRGSADGNGDLARFNSVAYFATDAQDTIYAIDANRQTIRKGVYLGIAPAITTQPQSVAVATGGTALFAVTAGSTPAPSYQWYVGTHAIAGATSNSVTLSNVRSTDAGDYTVVVSNELGSATSNKATLTITTGTTPTPPTQPGQGGGGSGGGGAPSVWFVAILGVLGTARLFLRRT